MLPKVVPENEIQNGFNPVPETVSHCPPFEIHLAIFPGKDQPTTDCIRLQVGVSTNLVVHSPLRAVSGSSEKTGRHSS